MHFLIKLSKYYYLGVLTYFIPGMHYFLALYCQIVLHCQIVGFFCGGFTVAWPWDLVECYVGEVAMYSPNGDYAFSVRIRTVYLYICSSLLSSIANLIKVLMVGYLSGFMDFCNKQSHALRDKLWISCLFMFPPIHLLEDLSWEI